MHKLIWRAPLAAALMALGLYSPATSALAASGTALGVNPSAAAETKAETRSLVVGSDVFIGDRVVTGPEGQVQIQFSDMTRLVVGPNSALLIEDYLLRDDKSAGKFAINALSGTFRFATGRAPKNQYVITTPTGTIGVRGTEFDFNVTPDQTRVLLYNGAVLLCNPDQSCVTVDDSCELGQADLGQSQVLGNTDEMDKKQRDDVKSDFMYAVSQAPLLGRFRFEEAKQCFQKGFVSNVPESLVKSEAKPAPPVECPEEYYYYCYPD
ncbi:MAG: FecR domain-containing protein [Devosia sp.]|uniref:FecR family protein n=1 Tax=Devosia sp. TaxID=1871048 RepID=UPI001AD1D613|nr:FecR family protein [Devosia sp.]MBN9316230.1 FecR domain-containing protein [Devosia sp.]